jgi:hypothetical protein
MNKRHVILIAAPALIVGALIGAAGNHPAAPAAPAAVQTETKAVTPAACLDALTAGENVMTDAGQGVTLMEGYVGNMDVTSLTTLNSKVGDLTATVKADRAKYDLAAATCRATK